MSGAPGQVSGKSVGISPVRNGVCNRDSGGDMHERADQLVPGSSMQRSGLSTKSWCVQVLGSPEVV